MISSNRSRRRWTASAAFMVLAACSGNQTQTMVEPAGTTDTPNATVAVSVTRIDSDCSSRNERRCAELAAEELAAERV